MSLMQQSSSLNRIRCTYSNRTKGLRAIWSAGVNAHYLLENKEEAMLSEASEAGAVPCAMLARSLVWMSGISIGSGLAWIMSLPLNAPLSYVSIGLFQT